jgi:S-(hydroxymethyl)glutathione dehydrogenase / alcohol dehydrogenase
MKAAILREIRLPLEIEELELAEPQAGEVRVRIEAAGICHSDYHYICGDQVHPLPVVLGHEGAGVVQEIGPGVTSVSRGDHVVMLWRTSCGHCEYCNRGRPVLCSVGRRIRATGMLMDGTTRLHRARGGEVHHFLGVSCFAEATVCSEASIIKIPNDVPMPIAALVGCSVMTGVGAVVNTARVAPGSSVLVVGAGGVGLAVIMGAVLAGAGRIIAADLADFKLEMASSLGATDTINTSSVDLVEAVRTITGDGVDYSFEAIGTAHTMSRAVQALRRAGVATIIGLAPRETAFEVNALELVTEERSIKGSIYGSTRPAVDFHRLFELYQTGRLPLDRLLTRSYRLSEINLAFQAMLNGEVARSVVIP